MTEWLETVIDPYYLQVLILLGIYLILCLGLNLITGVTGQLSLGHAAFLSIGAYTGALLSLHAHWPFVLTLAAGGLVAALFGILLGFPTLRLAGDYLAIATLGFGEIIRVLLLNLEFTGGALGLAGIPKHTNIVVVYVLVALGIFAMYRLGRSRFGRALLAIREDEIAATSMGINAAWYKIQAFGIGSFYAGVGGVLYAHFLQYINPSDFGFLKSFELLSMVVLGGMGSIPGTVLGVSILTVAPEFLRFVQEYRMLLFGGLMVTLMIFRPNGLLGGIDLIRWLAEWRKAISRREGTAETGSGEEM